MKRLLLLITLTALLVPWAVQAEVLTFDFSKGIPSDWDNSGTYPWVVANEDPDNNPITGIKSSNSGVGSSNSMISATFTFLGEGSITFHAGCWGEGSSSIYDKCIFIIDGTTKFQYGALQAWDTYTYDVEAGEHTFTWNYSKDGSVDKEGDAFFLDYVRVDLGEVGALPKPTGLAVSGVTDHSAVLSWTENGTATAWKVAFKAEGEADFSEVNAGTIPFTLDGLSPLTAYTVKVCAVDGKDSPYSTEVQFSTTAVAVPVGDNWSDNFEGAECGWELINGTLTNAWAWGTAANNGGTHALYISNDGGTTNAYTSNSAVMVYAVKLLNFADGKYEFAYDWQANGESTYDYLRVALVPASVELAAGTSAPSGFGSSTLPTGWIALDGGSKLNLVTAWQSKSVAINVTSGNYYLVLAWRDDTSGGTNPPAAVDNVSIVKMACPYDVADLAVDGSSITTNTATLTWTAGDATQWQIAYSKDNSFPNGQTTIEIVSNAPASLTGLNASSTYFVKVRAYCGGSDFGAWSGVISFATECEALDLDQVASDTLWFEKFDSYTAAAGFLPNCWNRINTCSYSYYDASNYPRVYANSSYSTYAHSAPNCLYLYSYYYNSSSTDYDPQPQYAILPEMSNLAGKQITLWAKGSSATSTFKIGVMSDPADANTFATIADEQTLTTSYQEFIYNIPANATASYVAIMIEAADEDRTTNGVYIDDIVIANPPACPKPTDLVKSNVLKHSVQLGWTENGEATAWDIAYKADGETNFTIQPADANPYTLTGLDAETDYVVKVRANCEGSESVYTAEINFTTAIACATPVLSADSVKNITANSADVAWGGDAESYIVSYRTAAYVNAIFSEGFENGLGDWSLNNCHSSTGIDASADAAHSGSKGFKFYYRSNPPQYLISPELNKVEAGMLLSFYYKNYSTSFNETFQVGYSTTDNAIASFNFGGEITASDGNWHLFSEALADGVKYVCIKLTSDDKFYLYIDDVTIGSEVAAGEWVIDNNVTANSKQLTGLDAETLYEVKVQGNCGDLDGLSAACDSIQFATAAGCQIPDGLAANEIGVDSAVISWTTYGQAAFNLRYKADTVGAAWSNPIAVAQPHVLSGLSGNMVYKVQVQPTCAEATVWSDSMSFRTDCEAVIAFPWSEGFESYSAGDFADPCWVNEHISGSGTSIFKVYTSTNGTNTTHQLQLPDMSNGTLTKLVLPVMTLPNDNYQFILDVYRNAGGTSYTQEGIRIFASTDGEIEGATELAFISRNYTQTDGKLIPAEEASGWYTYELPIGISGTCYIILRGESKFGSATYMDNFFVKEIPSCLKPTGLVVSNVAATSATLAWVAGGTETTWEICLNGDETNPIAVNANPYDLTGLTDGTNYSVKVRAACSDTDKSDWSLEISFATPQIAVNVPFSDDFENGNKWLLVNGSLTNAWVWGEATSNGGKHALYISNDGGVTNAYTVNSAAMVYATKLFHFEAGKYVFAYDWKAVGESSTYSDYDYLRVALAPESVELSASTSTLTGLSSTGLPSGWIALDGGSALLDESDWQSFESAVIEIATAGNYKVVLAWRDDTSGGSNPPAAVDNFKIFKAQQVGFNASGYATFYDADNSYKLPAELTGHVFSTLNTPMLQQEYAAGEVIPAATPVVLKAEEIIASSKTYVLVSSDEAGVAPFYDNQLEGVNVYTDAVPTDANCEFFVLSLAAGEPADYSTVGFYYYSSTTVHGGFPLEAHKAYLKVPIIDLPSGNNAAGRFFIFNGENGATWLENLQGVEGTVKFMHEGKIFILREGVIYDATGRQVRKL